MKKLFSITLALLCAIGIQAQVDNTFDFVDQSGNVIADGTTITVHNYTEDELDGTIALHSGLYVTLHDQTMKGAMASMATDIQQITAGTQLDLCFPDNCVSMTEAGKKETGTGRVLQGEVKSLRSEWYPKGQYGTCTVSYTLRVMSNGEVKAQGPTVTVNYVYDAESVNGIATTKAASRSNRTYNLLGQPVGDNYKGIAIRNGKKILK